MPVVAGAEGEGEAVVQAPFVFREQRLLRKCEWARRHAVAHRCPPPLCADGGKVLAQGKEQLGVDHLAFRLERACAARHGARRARRDGAAQGLGPVAHGGRVQGAEA
ncbi:hypothetical protein D9M71_838270 [compost metagenome]